MVIPKVLNNYWSIRQGITNVVGMVLADGALPKNLIAMVISIVDHHTYVFAGDGCLMEGFRMKPVL